MPLPASLKATCGAIVRDNLAIRAVNENLGNPDLGLFPGGEDARGPGGPSASLGSTLPCESGAGSCGCSGGGEPELRGEGLCTLLFLMPRAASVHHSGTAPCKSTPAIT